MESSVRKYVHWIDLDSGLVTTVPASVPLEKLPFGFYVPGYEGSLAEMKKMERKFEDKPYLIEKHIKNYPQL